MKILFARDLSGLIYVDTKYRPMPKLSSQVWMRMAYIWVPVHLSTEKWAEYSRIFFLDWWQKGEWDIPTAFQDYHLQWRIVMYLHTDNTRAITCMCAFITRNLLINKQRVLMHRHQGLNVRHGLCHIYMRYLYIYELFIAFVCFVVCSLL